MAPGVSIVARAGVASLLLFSCSAFAPGQSRLPVRFGAAPLLARGSPLFKLRAAEAGLDTDLPASFDDAVVLAVASTQRALLDGHEKVRVDFDTSAGE